MDMDVESAMTKMSDQSKRFGGRSPVDWMMGWFVGEEVEAEWGKDDNLITMKQEYKMQIHDNITNGLASERAAIDARIEQQKLAGLTPPASPATPAEKSVATPGETESVFDTVPEGESSMEFDLGELVKQLSAPISGVMELAQATMTGGISAPGKDISI